MKKLKALFKGKKGISLVEVVIAMAAISIITAAAISLTLASISSDAKYNSRAEALTACENASECVRYADTKNELSGVLSMVSFGEPTKVEDATNTYQYTYTTGEYTVTVTVSVTAENEENIVSCTISLNNEEIYKIVK